MSLQRVWTLPDEQAFMISIDNLWIGWLSVSVPTGIGKKLRQIPLDGMNIVEILAHRNTGFLVDLGFWR